MNNKHSFSGLGGSIVPFIQAGMKKLAGRVGADFHPLLFGYVGWRKLAKQMVEAKIKGQVDKPFVLMGHSNGVYAALKIAQYLHKYKIKCVVVSVDRTLKYCPPASANVIYLQDHHATLKYATTDAFFKAAGGIHEIYEYPRPKGYFGSWHIGVSSDTILHDRVEALLKREGWL